MILLSLTAGSFECSLWREPLPYMTYFILVEGSQKIECSLAHLQNFELLCHRVGN